MSSGRPAGWEGLVEELKERPLEEVAASAGIEEAVFRVLLMEEGDAGPADRAPWWPEALRMRAAGTSLRAVAQRFGTEPRRIRRALARAGLRVAGADVAEGAPQLAAFRDQLGVQPDRVVARAAHVIPEAVQGERSRLGVGPYFQRRRVRLTADDEAWIRGPKKMRRERVRSDPETLQVVRRPASARGFDERVAERQAARRPEPGRAPGFQPRPYDDRRRDFFRNEGENEIARLLTPSRVPRENRRIVRADSPRAPEPTPFRSLPSAAAPVEEAPRRRIVTQSPPPVTRVANVATAAKVEPEVESGDVAWFVFVPGSEGPITIFAPDIATAVTRAGEHVAAHLLARAAIWRADEEPPVTTSWGDPA